MLYCFLGLLVLWLLVMAGVLCFSYSATSSGEKLPLNGSQAPKVEASARPRSWMSSNQPPQSLRTIDREIKKGFVRKVYSILATQLLITAGIAVGMIYASFYHGDPNYLTKFGNGFIYNSSLSFLLFILTIILLCFLFSLKNSYPANYLLLLAFTASISFTVARVCVIYYSAGSGTQILLAFAITAATFLALTTFTMISRVDWDFMGPFLFAGMFLLMFWSLIMSLVFAFGGGFSSGWSLAFAIVGTILFSGFIIYDTNNIMRYCGVDDYIIAAIELYLDVLNLFLFILQILTLSNNN
uniref:Transmembrane BAX inhibitor motif-containing protein 4 n=1 Tax=Haptolina ericina TaxID=156174 RepID=A0A7S3ABQ7_9EUKA